MVNSKLLMIGFIVIAAVQWYVPASMILGRESILATGKEYKFKTAPVDPSDPFRGKYITLDFLANNIKVSDKNAWDNKEAVFVLISTGKDGYAKIEAVSKVKPAVNRDFIKAKVDYMSNDSSLFIAYPFDRYYMEESKAAEAESAYTESSRDTAHTTYALVKIKDGEAVLKDVLIDGIPIKKIVQMGRNK